MRCADGRVRARPNAKPERDVLEDGHVPEERVVLKDEADAALARRAIADVLAVELDRRRRRRTPSRR